MGEVPDWYQHLRAAKYLGVAPWDLAAQPVFWREAALAAEQVEHDYQERQNQKSG